MSALVYHRNATDKTQAGGAFEIAVDSAANVHQIGTRKNGGSAGTLAVEVKPKNAASFEPLTINGVQVTIDLTADRTFGPFDGSFEAFKLTPSSFNGTDFDVHVAGW